MSRNRGRSPPIKTAAQADTELVKQIRDGDVEAFDHLVERYAQHLRVYLGSRCRSLEAVDEVSQETWVKAYTGLKTYDDARPFVAWLIGIARNHLADRARKQQALLMGGDRLDALIDQALIEQAPPEHNERLQHLDSCLQKMQQRARTMLIRHHGEGWTMKRLAQAYKLPTKRLAMQLLRMRRRLRDCVESQA